MCRPFVPPGRGKSSEGRGGEEGVGKGGRGVGRRKGGEEWEGKGGKEGGGKVRGREVPTVIWQRRGGGRGKLISTNKGKEVIDYSGLALPLMKKNVSIKKITHDTSTSVHNVLRQRERQLKQQNHAAKGACN